MNESTQHLHQASQDHDLLVRVDEKLNGVIMDMKNIGEKLKKVDALEIEKVNLLDHKDLEKEVDQLKMWRWIMSGAIIILSTMVIPMGIYIFKMQTSSLDQKYIDALKTVLQEYEVPTQ